MKVVSDSSKITIGYADLESGRMPAPVWGMSRGGGEGNVYGLPSVTGKGC